MKDKNDYKNNIIFTRDFRELNSCSWEIIKIFKNKVKVMNRAGDFNYLKVGEFVMNGKEVRHHMKVIRKYKKR